MTSKAGTLLLFVPNDLAELELVSRRLEEFGREFKLSVGDVSAVNLAIDEILTNIILYGVPRREDHQVRVYVQLEGNTLTIEIDDGGRPFDPFTIPEPELDAALEDRPVGGLGIHIVRRLMDDMSYRWDDGHNILTLTKNLRGGEQLAAATSRDQALIAEADEEGTIVFVVAGRLDAHGAVSLEDRLRARLEQGAARFVFDCGDLTSLSSAGLRVLLIAAKESSAAGGGVALAAARSGISQTIEIAGLSNLLPSYATREEALAAVMKV
jgi:serine/threonine-protein kinase RsbW